MDSTKGHCLLSRGDLFAIPIGFKRRSSNGFLHNIIKVRTYSHAQLKWSTLTRQITSRCKRLANIFLYALREPGTVNSCVFVSRRRPFRKSMVLRRPLESTDGASSTYPLSSDRETRFADNNPNLIVGNWNAPTLSAITMLHSSKKKSPGDCQGVTKTQGLNRDWGAIPTSLRPMIDYAISDASPD